MGFKLVRVDAPEPAKIPLVAGAQIIGRGSFPDCDDNRMSRKHAMVIVTGETVTLKSLHQNPCFYSISNAYQTSMLPQGKSVTLKSGDHFGLLPDTNWYELIFYRESTESASPSAMVLENRINLSESVLGTFSTQYGNKQVTGVKENTNARRNYVESTKHEHEDEDDNDSDSSTLSLEVERGEESTQEIESQPSISSFNPQNQVLKDPNTTPPQLGQTEAEKTHCDVQTLLSKRSHSPDRIVDAKKVKTEPESPMKEGSQVPTEEPQSTEESNTQKQDSNNTIEPQMSMDTEPQDTNNVNIEPHDHNNVNTDPNDANIDHLELLHSNADINKDSQDPMNVDTELKDPKYMNTESLAYNDANTEPEISYNSNDVRKEPQDPNDVNTEPTNFNTKPQNPIDELQNPIDVNTELPSPIDMNAEPNNSIDSPGPNDANTEQKEPMNGETEAQRNRNDIKKEPQSPDNAKDVKKEPKSPKDEDVKKEPDVAKPGPSHDQPGSSKDGDALPKPPNRPARERCIYGANCYRKNPQHKIQFSHPGEADYGDGDKGQCPYGASCRRRDPRHWAQHDHPPGAAPPAAPAPPHDQRRRQGLRVVQRRGQIFYINARSAHFHDDHYELEDQDGDSVDYDYEF